MFFTKKGYKRSALKRYYEVIAQLNRNCIHMQHVLLIENDCNWISACSSLDVANSRAVMVMVSLYKGSDDVNVHIHSNPVDDFDSKFFDSISPLGEFIISKNEDLEIINDVSVIKRWLQTYDERCRKCRLVFLEERKALLDSGMGNKCFILERFGKRIKLC